MVQKKNAQEFNHALVLAVRQYPYLYDCTDPRYNDLPKKQEAWNVIADRIEESVDQVKTRWRTLRDRYTKERRRLREVGGGTPSAGIFKYLNFLDPYIFEPNSGRKVTSLAVWKDPEAAKNFSEDYYERLSHEVEASQLSNANGILDDDVIFVEDDDSAVSSAPTQPQSLNDVLLLSTQSAVEAAARQSEDREPSLKKPKTESYQQQPSFSLAQLTQSTTVQVAQPTILKNHSPPMKQPESLADILESRQRARVSAPAISPLDVAASLSSVNVFERSVSPTESRNSPHLPADAGCTVVDGLMGKSKVDECFAAYVVAALQEMAPETRAHARMAVMQALTQFQFQS